MPTYTKPQVALGVLAVAGAVLALTGEAAVAGLAFAIVTVGGFLSLMNHDPDNHRPLTRGEVVRLVLPLVAVLSGIFIVSALV